MRGACHRAEHSQPAADHSEREFDPCGLEVKITGDRVIEESCNRAFSK